MALYVLSAAGMPIYKIGVSQAPDARLASLQAWSPVTLTVVAVDPRGDRLTEAELLYRLRADAMHSEWLAGSAVVRQTIAAIQVAGSVPGGWYLPGAVEPRSKSYPTVRPSDLMRRFGLSRKEYNEAVGNAQACGYHDIPLRHIPPLIDRLRARGVAITYHDVVGPALHLVKSDAA